MHTTSSTPVPTSSDPSLPLDAANERFAAAGADVVNLFAFFGAASGALAYQEICADAAAQRAARRWPLLAEWLADSALPAERDH